MEADERAWAACSCWPRRIEGSAQYEALVANPERVIRRTLDFCGCPSTPRGLEPHKIARAVLMPGASQVRQPLHSGSERTRVWRAIGDLQTGFGSRPE